MGYRVKTIDSRIRGTSLENEELETEVLVYADTEGDIPEPKDYWASGSAVLILDTQEVKFLNSEGEWI